MQTIKMRGVVAAVTGALLFGFGANAMADSTTDIVNALVAKGVLTEEEGKLINILTNNFITEEIKKSINIEEYKMRGFPSLHMNTATSLFTLIYLFFPKHE